MHSASSFALGDLGKEEDKEYEEVGLKNELLGTYRKLFFQNKKLVGGILYGDTALTNPLLIGISNGFDVEESADNKLM